MFQVSFISFSSRCSGYLFKFSNFLLHQNLRITLRKISFSRILRHLHVSTNSINSFEISGIFSLIPRQHFSDATILAFILLVECIHRRNSHVVTPADFVSHNSQDILEQHMDRKMRMYSELHAQAAQSSSILPSVLHLLPLILFCQLGCFSFCSLRAGFSLMSPPEASAC